MCGLGGVHLLVGFSGGVVWMGGGVVQWRRRWRGGGEGLALSSGVVWLGGGGEVMGEEAAMSGADSVSDTELTLGGSMGESVESWLIMGDGGVVGRFAICCW